MMANKFSEFKDEVIRNFREGKWQKEAAACLSDKTKMKTLLGLVLLLFKRRALGPVLKDLILLYYYVKDVVEGNYKNYSRSKLILVVAVLVYVVSPLDFIPDFIVGAGFLDDAALITFIIRLADKELAKYYTWNRNRRETEVKETED